MRSQETGGSRRGQHYGGAPMKDLTGTEGVGAAENN